MRSWPGSWPRLMTARHRRPNGPPDRLPRKAACPASAIPPRTVVCATGYGRTREVEMNHRTWLAQTDIYALGALDGDDLTAFETHLAVGCPECERQLVTAHEALTLLPHSLELIAPPPTVKARLLTQIAAETANPQPVT